MKQAMRFRFQDGPICTVDEIEISAQMPKPDDPEFLPKLDKYFRRYAQAALSAGDDEIRGSVFDELKRMLEQRDDVLKAHATFTKAKGEVNRHVGTCDNAVSNSGFPNSLAVARSTTDRIALMQKNAEEFWKNPGRPTIDKVYADFWDKHSEQFESNFTS